MPAPVTLNRATHGPTDTITNVIYNGETVASASVRDATESLPGVVQFAADGAEAADRVPKATDTRLGNARAWNGSLGAGVTPAAARATLEIPAGVALGTTAGTACEGNDPRLSDARTPTTHGHPTSQVTGLDAALTTLDNDLSTAEAKLVTLEMYRLLPVINVQVSGALGDDSANDTTAIQAALTASASNKLPVIFPKGIYRINAGLTAADTGPIIMMPGAVIKPTGSGYTALTITSPKAFSRGWSITIDSGAATVGARVAVNGLSVDNFAGNTVHLIRVNGLNGFGVKLNKCWDTVFENISVELCGNSSNFAFSVLAPDTDTCNESHFLRLQVEQAQECVISIHANTLNCHWGLIHCERYTCTSSRVAITLGGNRGRYDAVRISALTNTDATNGTVMLDGASGITYANLMVENANSLVQANAYSSTTMTVESPDIAGTFRLFQDQTGVVTVIAGQIATVGAYLLGLRMLGTKVTTLADGVTGTLGNAVFDGCDIGTVAVSSGARELLFIGGRITTLTHSNGATFDVRGTRVTTLSVGDCGGSRDRLLVRVTAGAYIGALNQSSGQAAITLKNATVAAVTSFPDHVHAWSTDFTQTSELTKAFGQLNAYDCHFFGALTSDTAQLTMDSCRIDGELKQSAGSISGVFTGMMQISGAVTLGSLGTSAPAGGTWKRGQRTDNQRPQVGDPKGWVCTVAGTPGTWVSTGNL